MSMLPVGFEPTISAFERPRTYALDCAATGTGIFTYLSYLNLGIILSQTVSQTEKAGFQLFGAKHTNILSEQQNKGSATWTTA